MNIQGTAIGFAKQVMMKKTEEDCTREIQQNRIQNGIGVPGEQCLKDMEMVEKLSAAESIFKAQ